MAKPKRRPHKRDKCGAVLLEGLFTALEKDLGEFHSALPHVEFARSRMSNRMRKRAANSNPALAEKAFADFVALNTELKSKVPNLTPEVVGNAKLFIARALERAVKAYDNSNVQMTLDWAYLVDNWKFGPGASEGVQGTHTAEKIHQDMTATPLSELLVYKLRRSQPYLWRFDSLRKCCGVRVVRGSRLTSVPKNEEVVRTIAIEPSGNMALQLAAGRIIEDALRLLGLDIKNQQRKNRLLARLGSMTGGFATIDLKSASDMITIPLVRLLWPDEWFELFMRLRSPEAKIPGHGWVELNMISTMGNGTTFPMMTLTLVALIYAFRATKAEASRSPLYVDWRKTAVFGDDIIIPTEEFEGVCEVLTGAGFVVNRDKSYSSGPFRESCGGDYYEGHYVTPVYIQSVKLLPDIFVAINQLAEWSCLYGIPLTRSIGYLTKLPRFKPYFVPEWLGANQGIRTAQCPRRYTYLKAVSRKFKIREDSPFLFPLAAGGYIESMGRSTVFTPRDAVRSVERKGRLPRGYATGWDPLTRSTCLSRDVSQLFEALMA